MALWLWRRLKHGCSSYRRNNNRLDRYSISMQNLSKRRFDHFNKDFDDDGADFSDANRNECDCDKHGWVNRKTFEGHVQDVVLKVRTNDGKVMSKDGLQLPCPLEELGCDTTSFDPYAYTWDAPDNSVLAIHRKKDVNMIKQGKNNYYIVS